MFRATSSRKLVLTTGAKLVALRLTMNEWLLRWAVLWLMAPASPRPEAPVAQGPSLQLLPGGCEASLTSGSGILGKSLFSELLLYWEIRYTPPNVQKARVND